MTRRPAVLIVAIAALLILVAIPVLAASPSPGPGSNGRGPEEKPPKAPELAVTLNGTVEASTDTSGKTTYTLRSGGKTYTLEAGPAWFFGDQNPLKPYVGKSVTIVGEQAAGSSELEVTSVDGTALRAPGRPPWAGGWKVVGERHPGWSQEKADRFKAKFGDCFPPGHCKDKPAKGNPAASATP